MDESQVHEEGGQLRQKGVELSRLYSMDQSDLNENGYVKWIHDEN